MADRRTVPKRDGQFNLVHDMIKKGQQILDDKSSSFCLDKEKIFGVKYSLPTLELNKEGKYP